MRSHVGGQCRRVLLAGEPRRSARVNLDRIRLQRPTEHPVVVLEQPLADQLPSLAGLDHVHVVSSPPQRVPAPAVSSGTVSRPGARRPTTRRSSPPRTLTPRTITAPSPAASSG